MFLTKKWKRHIRSQEAELVGLKQQLARLNCEAGRHEWEVRGADKPDPRNPPYMRCIHCYQMPKGGHPSD